MRKIFALAQMVILSAVTASASVSIGLQGSYFFPTDSDFKNIYGGGWMYGGEFMFTLAKSLDGWLEGEYFSKKGSLTYTKEETKVTLIPISAGLRFRILQGNISPYVGAGARYYLYREENVIGEVKKGGGWFRRKNRPCDHPIQLVRPRHSGKILFLQVEAGGFLV